MLPKSGIPKTGIPKARVSEARDSENGQIHGPLFQTPLRLPVNNPLSALRDIAKESQKGSFEAFLTLSCLFPESSGVRLRLPAPRDFFWASFRALKKVLNTLSAPESRIAIRQRFSPQTRASHGISAIGISFVRFFMKRDGVPDMGTKRLNLKECRGSKGQVSRLYWGLEKHPRV